MRSSYYPSLVAAFAAAQAFAADWHYVSFTTPPGQEFLSLSGYMITPEIHEAAVNYLWPGLQPTDNTGVYQNVLDGRSGGWWFGTGWCCSNPSLPWGGGFGAAEGDILFFNNTKTDSVNWVSQVTKNDDEGSATNSFALGSKTMNFAAFAAELYGKWDFGPLIFLDVTLIATGSDTSFCTDNPYHPATNLNITGVTSTVADNKVTCHIESLILEGPA